MATILVKAGDGYTKDFSSETARSNDYIIANKCTQPLSDKAWLFVLWVDGVATMENLPAPASARKLN